MPKCHEMKKGEIYTCPDCGLEIEVVKNCACGEEPGDCKCEEVKGFVCCGKELEKKK